MRLALVLGMALLVAPAAAGERFVAELPFTDLATAGHLPVLSGSLDVLSPARGAPTVMHNVTSFDITGLAVVCWTYPCHEASGPLMVRVSTGSTVALRFPASGTLHLAAGHAVAAPVDLDAEKSGFADLAAGLQLAPSLAAATKGGVLTVEPEEFPPAPDGAVPAQDPVGLPGAVAAFFQAPNPDDEDGAVLATLSEGSRLEVLDGGRLVHTISGQGGGLLLQGSIMVDPVQAQAFLLPCPVRCEVAVVNQGVRADVRAATSSILELVALAQGGVVPPIQFGPWAGLLDPVAVGVFLDLPLIGDAAQFSVSNLTFVRFQRFATILYPGAPAVDGTGPLVIQSGSVQGSPEFVGGRYFGMPLWSYLLWGAALVAIVVAAIARAPKHHDRWDRLQWVGRVAGAVALAVLLIVWHVNFDRVLGVSATSGGLDAGSRLLIGAIEAGTFLAMAFMVVLPARLLLSRTFCVARQGRLMGLAGPLASIVGILVGTPLLLGFVDLALRLFQ